MIPCQKKAFTSERASDLNEIAITCKEDITSLCGCLETSTTTGKGGINDIFKMSNNATDLASALRFYANRLEECEEYYETHQKKGHLKNPPTNFDVYKNGWLHKKSLFVRPTEIVRYYKSSEGIKIIPGKVRVLGPIGWEVFK